MRLYRSGGLQHFELCVLENKGEYERIFRCLNGTPLIGTWQPCAVQIVHTDEGKPLAHSDAPSMALSSMLVLRPRAVSAMKDLLLMHGELLPLRCDEDDLKLFNCTSVRDALDESRSEITRFSTGRIMSIDRHEFRPHAIAEVDIFRLPRERASDIFFSERFVEQWRRAGLRGLRFTPVWSGG